MMIPAIAKPTVTIAACRGQTRFPVTPAILVSTDISFSSHDLNSANRRLSDVTGTVNRARAGDRTPGDAGASNPEVAEAVFLSRKTIERQHSNIMA
jgi:hypothetical protein